LTERRPVRTYVLRQGRITEAQRRAFETLYARYGLPYTPQQIDAREVFGRDAPLILEIGSGMGETTSQIARDRPEVDFIAVEVHAPGVGSLLNRIDSEAISNLRVIRHDAIDVLEHMIPDGALAGLYVFFPDPWPKKRHHKRRLVQAEFAALAARKLRPGGVLHAATDWQEYAEQMLAVLSSEPLLENTSVGFALRPAYRPPTKFELRGLRLGHRSWDVVFRRR